MENVMDAADIQKRKDRTITLSIETKVREFPGKVLLSCYLAERGFRVILSNTRKSNNVVREGSWLFIDRNTFSNRKPFFKNLRRNNVDIGCIDEEGIVWANPQIYLRRLDRDVMNMTRLFFTWGKKQTEMVTQKSETTKVIESGNPRMDLLRPELRGIYKEQVEELKAKYGDFVLVVSNFAWNNHYYVDGEKENPAEAFINLRKRQGHIQTKDDEEFELDNLAYKDKVFDKMKEMVAYIGKALPDTPIIVRPHPSENHETWKKAVEGHENIQVVFEGELEAWVIAARAILHNSCTTGILAGLVNKKSIAYMPFDDNKFEHKFPNDVSAKAYTLGEVLELVKQSPLEQEVPDLIKEYVSSLSGSFAAENIADSILEAYIERVNSGRRFSLKAVVDRAVLLYKKVKKKIVRRKRYSEFSGDYKKQKLNSLEAEEVNDCIAVYTKLLGGFEGVVSQDRGEGVEILLKE